MTESGVPSGGTTIEFPPQSAAQFSVEVQLGYHAVKFYSSALDVANAAGPFLAGALIHGEPAALIARGQISNAILHSLQRTGVDVDAARRDGTLLVVDFDRALTATSQDGRIDAARFERFTDSLAAQLRASVRPSRARIYCELGTELCRVGREDEAIELERLRGAFLERSGCGLLCGYSVRDFSRASHPKAYVEICGLHQRVLHERNVLGILQETKRELELLRREADVLALKIRKRANAEAAGSDEASGDRLEALHRLAAGVSRLFDDSLTLALGWGELLGRLDLPAEDLREVGTQIAQAASAASAMSRRLLAFGERGGPGSKLVRVEDGIRDAWRLIEMAGGGGTRCALAIDADAGRLAMPRNELAELIVRLGLGALERTGESGNVQLRVECLEAEGAAGAWSALQPGRYVLLEVSADGPRESEAELRLAAVEQIVAKRGGGMRVRTGPGIGTTVCAALPAASQLEPESAATEHAAARSGTILVVEPRPALRRLIVMQLEIMDHRVIGCADRDQAAAAIDLVDQVDCLVTDPPTAAGIAAKLSKRFPASAVLLIAARGETDSAQMGAVAAARVDVLEKPFSATDLGRRVNALLRPD